MSELWLEDEHIVYKLHNVGSKSLLREALRLKEWIRLVCPDEDSETSEEEAMDPNCWRFWFSSRRFTKSDLNGLLRHQRVNHFRESRILTRKDELARIMKRLGNTYGFPFDFFPPCFLLPGESSKWQLFHGENKPCVWICKPADMARGRQISIVTEPFLNYSRPFIVQQYLDKPLLINGFKFDLRLYVFVNRFKPMEAWLFNEGLARLATERYSSDKATVNNLNMHLTNTSLSKKSNTVGTTDLSVMSEKAKMTMSDVLGHIGVEKWAIIWHQIRRMVYLTLLAAAEEKNIITEKSFELLGFDVMIDSNYKPWLLEINCSPSLNQDTEVDRYVKSTMLVKMMDILENDGDSPKSPGNDLDYELLYPENDYGEHLQVEETVGSTVAAIKRYCTV